MEYISKAKIIDRIESMYRTWGESYDAQQILGDIEDMTPADVREEKKGRWLTYGTGLYSHCKCSVCGDVMRIPARDQTEYCPSCGAFMWNPIAEKYPNPMQQAEKKISLLIEDIEDGKGDYKLLPGFYEALSIIRGET